MAVTTKNIAIPADCIWASIGFGLKSQAAAPQNKRHQVLGRALKVLLTERLLVHHRADLHIKVGIGLGGGPDGEEEVHAVHRGDAPSAQPDARFDRARLMLRSGQVESAMAEIERLPGAPLPAPAPRCSLLGALWAPHNTGAASFFIFAFCTFIWSLGSPKVTQGDWMLTKEKPG